MTNGVLRMMEISKQPQLTDWGNTVMSSGALNPENFMSILLRTQ